MDERASPKTQALCYFVTALLMCFCAGFIVFRTPPRDSNSRRVASPVSPAPSASNQPSGIAGPEASVPLELVPARREAPRLPPPAAYQPSAGRDAGATDKTLDIRLRPHAGCAGLIAANGGLAPNENSRFFKQHGFKLALALSDEDGAVALNGGRLAAAAMTADALAVHGRQLHAVVPAQFGFSRGGIGILARGELQNINALKGKILAAAQFTETDFFIRCLALEAGLGVNMLNDFRAVPDASRMNLVYCKNAAAAGDLLLAEIKANRPWLSGCVAAPASLPVGVVAPASLPVEAALQSAERVHILATSRNLLVIADVLAVNKGFAERNPEMVDVLVSGLLEGNRMLREHPEAHLDTLAAAYKWDRDRTRAELAQVHLANLPENLAFFSGELDGAGSFRSICQSAALAYGKELIGVEDGGTGALALLELRSLKAAEASGAFKDQRIALVPLRSPAGRDAAAPAEGAPLLSRDFHFQVQADSHELDAENAENKRGLEALANLLRIGPGSTLLLRVHLDNGQHESGELALKAIELSRQRGEAIKRVLVEKHSVDAGRIEARGRGWEEPLGSDTEKNRRVEAQWFVVE